MRRSESRWAPHHRSRTRHPVDHGQLTDDGTGAEHGENALTTDARLEKSLIDAVVPIAFIARRKQDLID
jgi:hypothetical protein